tara:strand:+ start:1807 stop:2523 length:717 start_codon:yes stop_codon:yes gene_type:complete
MSKLKVDDIQSRQSDSDGISLASDSSVSLKHSASAKLTTTATGVTVSGTCTATTFSGSGASLTSLPAANLTGTLPAIDGSNLTNISGGSSPAPPCWYANQSGNYDIPNATWTTITYLNQYEIDPTGNGSGWNGITGIYTVQTGQAGIYYVFGAVGIDDIQSDDLVRVGISKNNDTPAIYDEIRAQSTESNGIYGMNTSIMLSLAVNDTVRLKVYHNEGSTQPTELAQTYFGGFRIVAT